MRLILIYTGRFQPWHAGHHDVVRSLLTSSDHAVLYDESDKELFRQHSMLHLYIAVADTQIDRNNPLNVGQRRQLINAALDHDPDLVEVRHKISVESLARKTSIAEEHTAFLATIPQIGTRYFLSGNPCTIASDRASDIRVIHVQNRATVRDISATRIRELVISNTQESMSEVSKLLPPGVYDKMAEEGMFDQIRRVAAGG
jgi:phosphopantetheine adenylyltransferase